MVAAETMSAAAMAAARSSVAVTRSPGRSRSAASARARSGLRFQIATSAIGRTEACAAMRRGASAPAPTITMRRASGRGQIRRRQRRGGGGPPQGQRLPVEGGKRLAAVAVEEQVGPGHARLAARGVAGEDRDDLHARIAARPVLPRRHEQQRRIAVGPDEAVVMAGRNRDIGAEGLREAPRSARAR